MGNNTSSSSSNRPQRSKNQSMPSSSTTRGPNPPSKDYAPPPPPYTLEDAGASSSTQPPVTSQAQAPPPANPFVGNAQRGSVRRPQSPNSGWVGGFQVEVNPQNAPPTTTYAPPSHPPPPQSSAPAPATGASLRRSNTREDVLEMLKKFDTVIVVDDSSSMAGKRWRDTRAALAELAGTASGYDVDGVDIHFLNSPVVGDNIKDRQAVEALFDSIDPDGITPTGEKLEILLLDYILKIEEAQDKDKASGNNAGAALKAIKPLNLIVLTDGEPSDDPESVIITAARRLDSRHFPLSQVGIQFVQIGDDPNAAEALKELDEALAGAHGIRDMVDTTPFSPALAASSPHDIAKMLLGGVNRRVDKRGV